MLHGADTLVFVLYNMVHLLNNSIIKIIIYQPGAECGNSMHD